AEIGGAALLIAPFGPVRTAAVLGLCAMNVLFGLCLEIGLFPWVASVALIGLLPSWFWERRAVGVVVQSIDRAMRSLASRLAESVVPSLRRPLFAEAVCTILLLHVTTWCIAVARDPTHRAPSSIEWLGSTFFLQQDWRMFSLPPARTGWIVIHGRL